MVSLLFFLPPVVLDYFEGSTLCEQSLHSLSPSLSINTNDTQISNIL